MVYYYQKRSHRLGPTRSILQLSAYFTLHLLYNLNNKRLDPRKAQRPKRVKFTRTVGGSILGRHNRINHKDLLHIASIYPQQDKLGLDSKLQSTPDFNEFSHLLLEIIEVEYREK